MSNQHHHKPHSDGSGIHHEHVPYWKRAHTDWRFWIGVILMFAAMIVYVMSDNLAIRPRLEVPSPALEIGGK